MFSLRRVGHRLFLLALLLESSIVWASITPLRSPQAKGYDVKDAKRPLQFHFVLTPDSKLVGRERSQFSGPDFKPLVDEILDENMGTFTRYYYIRHQVDEEASVERRGEKLFFSRRVLSKQSSRTEVAPKSVLVGPQVPLYIVNHWQQLLDRKSLKFSLAVPERLHCYPFVLRYDGEVEENGTQLIRFKLKIDSLFISWFVDPIFFYFSKDGAKLFKVVGRSMPLKKQGDRYVPLDAVMEFTP